VQVRADAFAFDRYGKRIDPKAPLNLADCGSASGSWFFGQELQELVKPLPAISSRDEAFPIRDRQLDRCQARRQDRARDDDPGRRLLMDDQIGADSRHGPLQDYAKDSLYPAETAPDIGGAFVGGRVFRRRRESCARGRDRATAGIRRRYREVSRQAAPAHRRL
jgi:hypothetical protein